MYKVIRHLCREWTGNGSRETQHIFSCGDLVKRKKNQYKKWKGMLFPSACHFIQIHQGIMIN